MFPAMSASKNCPNKKAAAQPAPTAIIVNVSTKTLKVYQPQVVAFAMQHRHANQHDRYLPGTYLPSDSHRRRATCAPARRFSQRPQHAIPKKAHRQHAQPIADQCHKARASEWHTRPLLWPAGHGMLAPGARTTNRAPVPPKATLIHPIQRLPPDALKLSPLAPSVLALRPRPMGASRHGCRERCRSEPEARGPSLGPPRSGSSKFLVDRIVQNPNSYHKANL